MKLTEQILKTLGFEKTGSIFSHDSCLAIRKEGSGLFSVSFSGITHTVETVKELVDFNSVFAESVFITPLRDVLNNIECDYDVVCYGGSGFENAEDAMFDVTDRFDIVHKFIGVEEAEAFYNNLKGEKCCWQMSELIMCHTKKA